MWYKALVSWLSMVWTSDPMSKINADSEEANSKPPLLSLDNCLWNEYVFRWTILFIFCSDHMEFSVIGFTLFSSFKSLSGIKDSSVFSTQFCYACGFIQFYWYMDLHRVCSIFSYNNCVCSLIWVVLMLLETYLISQPD